MNVLTYGTYDLFHHGHLRLLQRAKALGSHLTVGVSTDAFNAIKGKQCVERHNARVRSVAACPAVDRVIAEASWAQKRSDVQRYRIDLFVMGDDWAGAFDDLRRWCDVLYLPRTPDISSTQLRAALALGTAR
jgi:glycerol-3-phosphate cytidylyltransferase